MILFWQTLKNCLTMKMNFWLVNCCFFLDLICLPINLILLCNIFLSSLVYMFHFGVLYVASVLRLIVFYF